MANLKLLSTLLVASMVGVCYGEWMSMNLTDDKYSMKYMVDDNCTEVTFQLILSGLPSNYMPSSGSSGLWMGLGLGKSVMADADYWSCQYTWRSDDSTSFVFHDWVYYPDIDNPGTFRWSENQDFVSTSTITKDRNNGEFNCQFSRKLDTMDEDDYTITPN